MGRLWLPDSRMMMPGLFHPGFQPTQPVAVDQSHPLAPNWGFWLFGNSEKNLVTGSRPIIGAGVIKSRSGLVFGNVANSYADLNSGSLSPNFTVFAKVYLTNSTVDHGIFSIDNITFLMWADRQTDQLRLSTYAGSANNTPTNSIPANNWVTLAAIIDGEANTSQMFINGVQSGAIANIGSSIFENIANIYIGNSNLDDRRMRGTYSLLYVDNKKRHAVDIARLHANCNQFLVPA